MLPSNRKGALVNARESDSSLIKQLYKLRKDWSRNWKHNICVTSAHSGALSPSGEDSLPFKPLGSTSRVTCLPVHPSICCILHLSVLRIYTFSRCYYKIEIVCASMSVYVGRLTFSFPTPLFKEVVPGSLVTLAMTASFCMSAALDWPFQLHSYWQRHKLPDICHLVFTAGQCGVKACKLSSQSWGDSEQSVSMPLENFSDMWHIRFLETWRGDVAVVLTWQVSRTLIFDYQDYLTPSHRAACFSVLH